MGHTLAWVALAIWIHMTVFYLLALVAKRNDLADVAWGLGFAVVALVSGWIVPGATPRQTLLLVMVVAWALRLDLHIWSRNRGKAEDFRYNKWREDWADQFLWRSYLQVFMLQGLIMLVTSLPIWLTNTTDTGGLTALNIVGLFVWAVGLLFETQADHQLSEFQQDPANRGQLITTGLWRYTRHPNYFGEALLWWGLWLVTIGTPWWPLGALGPALLTYLLVQVSGVPMLEKRLATKPGWAAYAARTSVFVPWFPRRDGAQEKDERS